MRIKTGMEIERKLWCLGLLTFLDRMRKHIGNSLQHRPLTLFSLKDQRGLISLEKTFNNNFLCAVKIKEITEKNLIKLRKIVTIN